MSSTSCDDLGRLIMRLALGIFILMHGLSKLFNGIGGIESMLNAHGLPAFFAWGAYIGEVVAPVLLILGIYARLGALLVAINMVVAILLAHSHQLFMISGSGGWQLELQGMFLFTAIALICLGAGAYSLGGRNGRWN
ncbi:DoxX family protein [Pusillimonas noertemannii]|uniref:Putative oxidoreductase n=1 Tax=Pusillimonas noertemannii TaxID=305977 RepID=A0A2U1CNA9_9BURK|nr:DoxX family protein [Pusillimonas noertemannii]NYT68484.1 DoxX family protein [Pusillimonas noertemannii]PVY62499.1 putative oxidoreductase [Pusillimonas noertemannii]TFL10547.1 DoxX family protein [Pusillimonas noertemannii]